MNELHEVNMPCVHPAFLITSSDLMSYKRYNVKAIPFEILEVEVEWNILSHARWAGSPSNRQTSEPRQDTVR